MSPHIFHVLHLLTFLPRPWMAAQVIGNGKGGKMAGGGALVQSVSKLEPFLPRKIYSCKFVHPLPDEAPPLFRTPVWWHQ